MPIVTLRDLYIAELRDLFDAERQIISSLPDMVAAATSSELRDALSDHLEQTTVQLQRLELLLRKLNVCEPAHPCEAMRGLVAEGRRRIADTERGDVLDAALIGAAQRIEHYEIAAYGCARTYARTLRDEEAASLLQQTLDEEGAADHRLSRIAERGVNQSAGDDVALDAERQRMRLRYLPAAELSNMPHRDFHVRNAADEDLGTLDGLVVDSRTNRPAYFVVDSGGWFVGRRFLIPIGLVQVDERAQALKTDLTRESIRRYPPFNPGAFADESIDQFDAASPAYQPPTWLMTGVWMTEASGFAAVPPRADAGTCSPAPERPPAEVSYPENELMMARGEPEDRGAAVKTQPQEPEERDSEPRIERYPER
jgi:ferritin-like metal-binding protein YciE